MQEINIACHIKELMIFDDPEYCNDEQNGCCYCMLIPHTTSYRCLLHKKHIEHSHIFKIKCGACKAAYQAAKNAESEDKTDQKSAITNYGNLINGSAVR